MKQSRILMGMPISIEIVDNFPKEIIEGAIQKAFSYFEYVDQKFSVYKDNSEITKINKGLIKESDYSEDMKTVFKLSEEVRIRTDGYFNIFHNGKYNPSGLVKGWAIYNVYKLIKDLGFKNFYVNAGGDIQVYGKNASGKNWSLGIRNPFNLEEIVKVIYLNNNEGVATSGTYIRGQHIYNPKKPGEPITEIVSMTVIGKNIYEADLMATTAFVMGRSGINFIEEIKGLEGYMIDKDGIATMTTGFEKYTTQNNA